MTAETATAAFASPLGPVTLRANAQWLTGIRLGSLADRASPGLRRGAVSHPLLSRAMDQLEQWFAGRRTSFDLPIEPATGEDGERLRAAIASIPYGETRTYGALADAYGSIARAVGQACKTNAFPIIIPCHRVVSTSGPEYYSGGDGPRTKTWLLDFEHDHLPPDRRTRLI